MRLLRPIGIGLLLLAGQLCASAAELALLKNGSTIPFLRKEQIGTMTRLYIPGGHLDIPSSQIASYDKDDSPLDDLTSDAQPPPATPSMPKAPAAAANPAPARAQSARAMVQPAIAPSRVDINELVRQAASKHQLDPDFVASVIKARLNSESELSNPWLQMHFH